VAPSDFNAIPYRRPHRRALPDIRYMALGLRARLFAWGLDELLADGIDPASDPALAVRATQLLSLRHRRRLATSIERVVREADASLQPRVSLAVRTAREQVTEARTSLLFLAHLLREAEPIAPRGVAIVERLLTDGGSALYVGGVRGVVVLQVQAALDYLVGSEHASPEAWFSVPDTERRDLVGHP